MARHLLRLERDKMEMPANMSLEHLRALLHARTDLHSDLDGALVDLAARARRALDASRALVALPDGAGWRACVDTGQILGDTLVGLVASTEVLRRTFEEGPSRTCVTLADVRRSGSLDGQRIHSVLAIPLRRYGEAGSATDPAPLGVLYLDRRDDLPAFTADEEAWARDFAALAERSLTLVELLARARRERDAARLETETLRQRETGIELDVLDSRDPGFQANVTRVLERAARAQRITLLLQGPTGSGKTHLARRFHALSARKGRPFVTLDCGQASSADALAAELFGFARKSGFAVDAGGRPGKALLADGGILFIDEVNSMPLELQARLLRLVEAGRYSALGSGDEIQVDVQIIAAANEDLRVAVRERRFREDLYFRLSQVTLGLPSLAERRADVVPIAERMLVAAARHFEAGSLHFSADALATLEHFAWDGAGNLRGLQHTIERTVLMLEAGRRRIERDDLVLPELLAPAGTAGPATTNAPTDSTAPAAMAPAAPLRALLLDKIAEHRGVLARIAEDPALVARFGTGGRPIPHSTLRQRLARLGLLDELDAVRSANDATLEAVLAALRQHGNGVDAARALGISRDRLVWRLRQAGLTIGKVLGDDPRTAHADRHDAD
jgi:DNA-binding NtrC family response regulator